MRFSAIPFLRHSFFLVLGILFQIDFPYQLIFGEYIFLISATVLIICLVGLNQADRYKLRYLLSIFSYIVIFIFGISISKIADITQNKNHISKLNTTIDAYEANIISEPEEKEKSVKVELRIYRVSSNNQWREVSGKLMAYFAKDTISKKLKYGDLLLIRANPPLIESPKNPFEFNLKRFYGFKGITHRQFLNSTQYLRTGNQPEHRLTELAIKIRQTVDEVFTQYIPAERERNIASALILGIKNELDEEIQYAYAATGTMHVLAVSGLHVGIIYGLMVLLTNFLIAFKNGKTIQSIILLFLLWMYALVTGLCPSVLRAVTMLSIVIFANLGNRKSNIYNTLFLTVFILLVFNPFMLMEVGFQLSFLAVLGIVYLHPKIYSVFEVNNPVLDWIWSITCMSVCAQLATFPLGMLYFHQFPNLFLLSNLIVIPFAILIMYIGLGFTLLSWIPFLAKWLGIIVEKMVWILNQIILTIEDIPHSLWLGIHISVFETWLIYSIIISFILLFVLKEFKYTSFGVALLLFFCGLQISRLYHWQQQKRLIVYNVNKGFAIDLIEGRYFEFISDSILPTDRSRMQFHILNYRWANGGRYVTSCKTMTKTQFGNVFVFNGLKFCQITRPGIFELEHLLQVDYLIISENAIKNLDRIINCFSFKTLIIDGSNKAYLTDKLEKQAMKWNLKVHSTSKNGAYILEL